MMAAPPMPGRRALNVVVLGMLLLGMAATPAAGEAPAGPGYHVSGNRIVDQSGTPFIVKGTDAVYGRFAGGDAHGYGLRNYQNAQRDLDNLKAQGVNTIRISVAYAEHTSGPLGSAEYLTEPDQAVSWVTQRGIIADLRQGEPGCPSDVLASDALLAERHPAT